MYISAPYAYMVFMETKVLDSLKVELYIVVSRCVGARNLSLEEQPVLLTAKPSA